MNDDWNLCSGNKPLRPKLGKGVRNCASGVKRYCLDSNSILEFSGLDSNVGSRLVCEFCVKLIQSMATKRRLLAYFLQDLSVDGLLMGKYA